MAKRINRASLKYEKNTKSSITLPASDLKMVSDLMKSLKAKTKVEVIRRGLILLKETTDRKFLRDAFKKASEATRATIRSEFKDQDSLEVP